MFTGKQGTESLKVQLTINMSKYQKYLKFKYRSLPLSSPEELLECSSSEYVSLHLETSRNYYSVETSISGQLKTLLGKSSNSSSTTKTTNKYKRFDKESLTLGDVLDVSEHENKTILIEGGPGMGKSTLAINMCKCWADGELLQEYDAVILLPLRDPEIQEARNIKDLLLIMDEELKEKVYKEIVNEDGNRVCFVFEGFDELPQELRSARVFSKLTEKLPQCTLVYTSRPEACDKLQRVVSTKIKICGFKEEQIDNYIKNAFEKVENGQEKATKLISQVQSNPTVKSILYVPVNVAIICHLFLLTLQLPNTLTQLYTLLCLNLILRHINKRNDGDAKVEYLDSFDDLPAQTSDQFLKLCLIAYRGRVDDKIIFSSRDIKGYGIDTSKMSDLGLLLIAPSTSVYGREKSYNFLHLTLQEFCAAFYISKFSTQEQLDCYNKFKFNDNFKMIWRFYSGITGLRNNDLLCQILPSKLALVYSDYTGIRTIDLLYHVYEAQNDDVCQLVGTHLNGNFILSGFGLDLNDCITVSYMLEQYRGEVKLNCRQCNIDDDCFGILVNSLLSHGNKNFSHLQLDFSYHCLTGDKGFSLISLLLSSLPILTLDMGDNKHIGIDAALCDSLHHNTTLKELYLDYSGLKPEHMQLLGQALTNNNTLSILDISDNEDIGPDGCQHLANVRNTSLSKLLMMECHIEDAGADHIGKMLLHNKSIRSVELTNNYIKDDGVKMLVEHLISNTTLRQLNLAHNFITNIGAGYLVKLFSCNPCKVNDIILDNNPLEDKGTDLILQSITTPMELLGLSNTCVNMRIPSLCMALHKVKFFSFSLPDDCDSISDSLADTTMLEGLMLWDGCDETYSTMIKGISRNNSIKTLFFMGGDLQQSMTNLAEVIKDNKTITTIGLFRIDVDDEDDYLILAAALAVNTSIKYMIIEPEKNAMCDSTSLKFVEQLKHNHTLELLVLESIWEDEYDQFEIDLEMLVEEINYTRQHHGVTTLLYVSVDMDICQYHLKQVNNILHN